MQRFLEQHWAMYDIKQNRTIPNGGVKDIFAEQLAWYLNSYTTLLWTLFTCCSSESIAVDWIGRIDNGNVRRRKVNRKVAGGIELPGRQSDIGENIKFNQISSQVQPKTNTPSSRSKNCSLSMEIKILVGISIIIKTYMCSCYNFLILVKAKKDPFLMWPNTNPIWSKKCGKTLVVRSG